jgi:hypothetical protein
VCHGLVKPHVYGFSGSRAAFRQSPRIVGEKMAVQDSRWRVALLTGVTGEDGEKARPESEDDVRQLIKDLMAADLAIDRREVAIGKNPI